MALLEIQDLRTYFSTRDGYVKAVDGVSMSVEPGEALGIVGESGSGKSVLNMTYMGLIPTPPGEIKSGKALFEGKDLLTMSKYDMQKIRGDKIAMIFQDPMTSLNPFLTIARQLTEVLEIHRNVTYKEALKQSIEMLEMVGIPAAAERIHSYPHQFSGGMRQRVMIAMGLLCRPQLLIADEPTTALDVTIQAQILDLLRELQKELHMALILITHNLGVVAGMTERINVMYAGNVVETASTENIFKNPQHPYTEALLKSVPRLDENRDQKLVPISGQPPDLSHLPSGCNFHPRCARAETRCRSDEPSLRPCGADQSAACWLAEKSAS